jgi:hypothetical protein
MDPVLAKTLVGESNKAVHWMKDVGIRWEILKEHANVGGKKYFEKGIAIHVAGGGIGQLEQWRAIAEAHGIEAVFIGQVTSRNKIELPGVLEVSLDAARDAFEGTIPRIMAH